MRLFMASVISIICISACAPAPVYAPVTPIMHVVGAAEAGQIIYAASETAQAMATSNAVATRDESAARATSTQAFRSTQDSVAAQQTLTALDLTRSAGQAVATEAAGVKTQSAGQTATSRPATQAAVATQARATAAAALAADVRATQAADWHESMLKAWDVGLLIAGVLTLVALGAAAAFGLSDWLSARGELLRARAGVEWARARQLWVMQFGGQLLQLGTGDRWEPMPQLAPPGREPLSVEPAAGDVREVPIHAHGEVVGLIPIQRPPETPEREKVIFLLRAAIGASGSGAHNIPPAPDLNMHPMEWQAAVDLLKYTPDHPGYVAVKLGRPKSGETPGPRLCQAGYKTLGGLLDGVVRGDVLPRPRASAASEPAGIIQNMPSE